MTSVNGSPEGDIIDILSSLESKTTGKTERHETYQKFTRLFKENEISLFAEDVVKNINRILSVIKKDIFSTSLDVNQGALEVLGVCLHDSEISRSMSVQTGENILVSLMDCIYKTEEKVTCTRALWCIGLQSLPVEAVRKQVPLIIEAVVFSVEKFGSVSVTIEHESINTIARLAEQCPREMEGESTIWGKILLPMVVHSAIKVRERALNVVEATIDLFKKYRKAIVMGVMPVFKLQVLPELKKLFGNKQELFVMRCWGIIVQLFGEELHHGSYINPILPIVELGFKSSSIDVKIAAFQAWQQLIDNFATNPSVLGDPKRVKLIMQVFKINNAKQENIALVKIKVWWHFIWLLGNKITANFDMVAVPLLHFCLGGSKSCEQNGPNTPRGVPNGTSPMTPKMNLTSTSTTQLPQFTALQLFGCEALAHFLGSSQQGHSLVEHNFKLDNLRQEVVTGPSFFIKQSHLLITMATDLFINLGKDVSESLLFHIWQCLIVHLKNAIESPVKLDIRDTLNTLLTRFQVVVLSQVLSSNILLKMFQSICELPEKVLSSSAYSVGGNEMINGTPALFLAGLLLTPSLLQSCSGQESYHTVFKSIVNCGVRNSSGTLGFLQSLLELVNNNGKCVEDKEMVWRLWSAIVNPLLEHISATNEVNQGDSLEPNFDCCVQALTFPVELKLATMTQTTVKSFVKTWTELYKTVNRLASMVTNANANVICEEVCQKMLKLNKDTEMKPEIIDVQVQICNVITSCLDYSSLGTQSTFNLAAVYSPKKSAKKRHQPLENIHSLVTLLCHLQKHAVDVVGESDQKKVGIPLQPMMNSLVDLYSTFFTHVTSTSIISHLIGQLAKPIGSLYLEASKKSSAKVYNNAFQQKLEKLWMEICTCLQSRYTGMYDSDLLAQLSPLFEATFLHSRRQIKNQTVAFWTSTFGSASTLVYPELLGPVLVKVKDKSVIKLPGWVHTNTTVIEETPMSQMSQSQVPEPRIMGMPSPHKVRGSFLNKAVSPKPSRSPMKSPVTTRAANSAKKKVFKGFDGGNDDDFVVIQPSPKKKMVLTEHQKEMMKERRVLPAMYNNLELSMDASLMSSHFATESQMESSNSTPTPTTETVPFSLFGSALNAISGQTKKTPEDKNVVKTGLEEDKAGENKKAQTDQQDIHTTSSTRRQTRAAAGLKSPDIDSTDSESKTGRQSSAKQRKQNKETKTLKSNSEESETNNGNKSEVPKQSPKMKQDSVIVIEESEPMEVETSQLILKPAEKTTGSIEIDLTKDSQETPVTQSGDTPISVPQNVLGIVGFTQPSSTTSSDSMKSANQNKLPDTLGTPADDNLGDSEVKKDNKGTSDKSKDFDKELSSSEPLFSWTQKLEALNQSPGLKQSPNKKSLSQDSKSPSKRGKSPLKSVKGKAKENSLGLKGALDKWLIRSPVKYLGFNVDSNVNKEVVVQSVHSSTYIEETQSPTKFNKNDSELLDKTNSPSIMETPTKNILEEIDVNHSHSNRKLFDSQSSNHDIAITEDSNFVPASPNSKSFVLRSGTPIVKINRLSNADILKYSPNNKQDASISLTPTKDILSDSPTKTAKCVVNFDVKALDEESSSSHVHDDFSDLKPLESDTDFTNVFSKSLTSTDKVLLQVNDELEDVGDVQESVKDTEDKGTDKSAVPVSPTLFSQFNDETDVQPKTGPELNSENQSVDSLVGQSEKQSIDKSDEQSAESENQSIEKETLINDSCESSGAASQGFSTESKSEAEENSSGETQEKPTPRRGRKRKQITPKKMSPDDAKLQKKKMKRESVKEKESEQNVQRKVSSRLKEKKLKQQNSQENESEISMDGGNSEQEVDAENVIENTEEEQTGVKLDGSQPSDEELAEINTIKPQMKNETEQKDTEIVLTEHARELDTTEKVSNDEEDTSKVIADDDGEQHKQTEQSVDNEVIDIDSTQQDTDNKTETPVDEHVQMEVEQIVAETTPKSRNTARVPERRSTTKHKKEVAQKMVLKTSQENRDELLMDTDSNLGGDEHFRNTDTVKRAVGNVEDMSNSNDEKCKDDSEKSSDLETFRIKGIKKSVKEKLLDNEEEKLIKSVTEQLNECDKEELTITGPAEDINKPGGVVKDKDECKPTENQNPKSVSDVSSSQSDDDVPLSQLKNKKNKRISTDKNKNETDVQRSPVSTKLRSNKVGTRLRSGQVKGKTSPQSKKSVSLALKRTRMKHKQMAANQAESTDQEDTVDKAAIEPLVNIDTIEKDFEKETGLLLEEVSVEKQHDNKSVPDSFQELFDSENLSVKSNVLDSVALKEPANTNETPRKLIERSKQVGSMLMMNSDSKLVLGSRRFEKRKGVARRSILKPSTASLTNQVGSPKRPDFHPIIVGQVYSPTASPSASILKKRRLLDAVDSDTNSPPAKQRRVSFAEPLEEAGNTLTDISKSLTTQTSEADNSEKDVVPLKQSGSQYSQSSSLQSSEGSISQGTYQSTQESQLNNSEPVCPDLVDCEQSVEKILPQLTSSIWSRGLGQLIRARNIKTIGDLSALSELDIQSLPIRSPKVQTVRKSLSKFQNLQAKSKFKDSPRLRLESKITVEEPTDLACQNEDPLVGASETVKGKSDPKETPVCVGAKNDEPHDINNTPSSSNSSFIDEMNRLSQSFLKKLEAGLNQPELKKETLKIFGELNQKFVMCLAEMENA